MKMISVLLFCLLYLSPLYADYSKMSQVLEDYTPPDYFSDALKFKLENQLESQNVPAKLDKDSSNLSSSIQNIKEFYEKRTGKNYEIIFFSDIDGELFKKMVDISSDSKLVKKRIQKSIILQEIEMLAGLRNPGVLAAGKQVKAEIESFNQVMNLDDNLKQYSAFTEGINTKIGPLKMKESIKQKYPFPGLTSLKGRIIAQQVAALVEKRSIIQKSVITQIRKAYWDIVFAGQSIDITSETIEAFKRLKGVATTLYKSGKTSFQDIIKINIKIEILKEDLVTLFSKKRNIEVKLLELLNIPVETKIGAVILHDPYKKIIHIEDLYSLARQNRQELKVIRHQINRMQLMIEMSESMIQEPFTLGLSAYEDKAVNTAGSGAAKSGFKEKTMASKKNQTPLKPWFGIDDPWLKQIRQKLSGLNQILIKQENATDSMVRKAWFFVDKNRREFDLYKKNILPLSKSALDVTTQEYEAGSIPFSQAIDSYTYWLKVKLTIAKKQADLGISIANLEKIIGTSF